MKTKTVMIFPNLGKEGVREQISQLNGIFRRYGARVLMANRAAEKSQDNKGVEFLPIAEAVKSSDFIVVLGGDGTMLSAAHYAAPCEIPLLGINLGHVGFITELEASEFELVGNVFRGEYSIENRMMLDVQVLREGIQVFHATALNEAVVTNFNLPHILGLLITADKVPVSSFRGDGVIVATPTGSTAYSLSAGGPVIEPSAENLAVTPICAHAIQAKSYIFGPEREICVLPDSQSACLTADGNEAYPLMPGDQVVLRKSPLCTRLIRVKGKSFYSVLKEKLSDRSVKA